MTVRELIDALSQFPDDMQVYRDDWEEGPTTAGPCRGTKHYVVYVASSFHKEWDYFDKVPSLRADKGERLLRTEDIVLID